MMIYLIFVQYMKHTMQITQERSEYDLITKSVKFVQHKRLFNYQKLTAVVCN